MPDLTAYSMTKGALDVLSWDLSKLLGARGITVNSVAPGIIDTDGTSEMLRSSEDARGGGGGDIGAGTRGGSGGCGGRGRLSRVGRRAMDDRELGGCHRRFADIGGFGMRRTWAAASRSVRLV